MDEKKEMDKKKEADLGSAEIPPEAKSLQDKPVDEAQRDVEANNGKTSIEEAKDVLKQISEQNKILAENLKRAEQINAEILISGRGRAVVQPTKEEREIDEARNLLKGSGYDDELFPRTK